MDRVKLLCPDLNRIKESLKVLGSSKRQTRFEIFDKPWHRSFLLQSLLLYAPIDLSSQELPPEA